MTKEQKIEAFSMRLDGKTYQEIGQKFNVSRQCIEQTLKGIIPERKKASINSEKCIYVGLAQYIYESHCTLKKLSEIINVTTNSTTTILKKITGKVGFTIKEIKTILDLTGMTFEECFKEKED